MLVTYPDVRNLSGCSLATRIFVTYPHAHYLSACVLTPGSCPPTGAATSPNISPLCSTSCAAASNRAAGQNSPRSACSQPKRDKTLPACTKRPKMRVFWRAGRILSREHPQTDHSGRILSRKTLRSGNAGRVPSRLQLRGRTLTSVCAHKTLDIDVGSTAHTHIIGPTCRSSGPRVPGAHTQGSTQYSQERGTHNHLKPRLSRAKKPKSHPASNTICPFS